MGKADLSRKISEENERNREKLGEGLFDSGVSLEELEELARDIDDPDDSEEVDQDDSTLVYTSQIKRVPKLESIRKDVRTKMMALGTYNENFRDAIEAYAIYKYRFLTAMKAWEEMGSPYIIVDDKGREKKPPELEEMDKAGSMYMRHQERLLLDPKSLEKIQKENEAGSINSLLVDID